MAMKLGKLATYGKASAPMKSHVPLTTWWHEVTWQTKSERYGHKIFLENKFSEKFAIPTICGPKVVTVKTQKRWYN